MSTPCSLSQARELPTRRRSLALSLILVATRSGSPLLPFARPPSPESGNSTRSRHQASAYDDRISRQPKGVKILDYGFSKILQREGDVLSTICGSSQYVAPEILSLSLGINEGGYTTAVDAWSIGVIIYMLLAGYAPFDDDNENVLFEKIMRGKPDFEEEPRNTVSSEAKDLVAGLLVVDPQLRLTVDEALESTFITQAQKYIERRKSGERRRSSSTRSI